jgi:hypothetical protein
MVDLTGIAVLLAEAEGLSVGSSKSFSKQEMRFAHQRSARRRMACALLLPAAGQPRVELRLELALVL